jgi:hypothetical protein
MNALIGHTGFVGSNLLAQRNYEHLFNSKNFRDMEGRTFSTVVCAGISAVKWQANKDPQDDWNKIAALMDALKTVASEEFILISTIDVYAETQGLDESFDNHGRPNHAYGTHRLQFEDFCTGHFPNCRVVRLPALFGPGLRKNILFDLMNDNCLEMVNPKSSFQYYDLRNLSADLDRIREHDVRLVNLFTEPLSTQSILDAYFAEKSVGRAPAKEGHYDLYTRHAALWGKTGHYAYSAQEVMRQLGDFVNGGGR